MKPLKTVQNKNKNLFYGETIPSDWNILAFGDVFDFLSTMSFSRNQLTKEQTQLGIQNIHYGDIHSSFQNEILDLDVEENVPFVIDDQLIDNDLKKLPFLKDGDLIIADASEDYKGIGECIEITNIGKRSIIGGLHTFVARDTNQFTAPGFRTYILNHPKVQKELKRLATGFSVFGISKTNLARIKIALPPINEQNSIASLLHLMDELIHTTNLLIAQKEKQQHWLINSLITGRKRFKKFETKKGFHKTDFGLQVPKDWKIVSVGDLFLERNERSSDQSKYPLYSLTIENGLTEKTERYERSFLLKDEENNPYKIVCHNDILFNPMNLRFGAIAKSKIKFPVLVSAYYNVVTQKNEQINVSFYESLFLTSNYNSFYERIAIGSLNEKKRVHLSNFLKLQVPLPTYAEQNAISRVLHCASEEIFLLIQKRKKLKEQKQWIMLQGLTGNKRLKNH